MARMTPEEMTSILKKLDEVGKLMDKLQAALEEIGKPEPKTEPQR